MRPGITKTTEFILATMMSVAFVLFAVLIGYRVWPVKTVDIKVPVPTEKAEYRPGDPVSAIFFGRIYWSGPSVTVRQVICANYSRFIKDYRDGDDTFQGTSRPRVLNGVTALVGNLPKDVPVNQQCIIQFDGDYQLDTPFGVRHIHATYYTQGFKIVAEQSSDTPSSSTTSSSSSTTTTTYYGGTTPPEASPAVTAPATATPRPSPGPAPSPLPTPGLLQRVLRSLL